MVLEIESCFGDCLLSGPDLSREALGVQLTLAQRESAGKRDRFVAVLERFGWTAATPDKRPQYRYDLDIGEFFPVKY